MPEDFANHRESGPIISVIIPTRNRSISLLRTLVSMSKQTACAQDYEIVVVNDGCSDDTAQLVPRLRMRCRIRLIEQPPTGRATARNRGAQASSAPLLLFLDDDMEAHPNLVACHLAGHSSSRSEQVIIGYFPLAKRATGTNIFHTKVESWWDAHFASQSRPDHQFTFRDFCTGNVSLPRELFERVGGFGTDFDGSAGEDYDLGLRLLAQKVRFRFERRASCLHNHTPTQDNFFARAEAEGAGHTLLRKKHGESFYAPNLSRIWHLQSLSGLRPIFRIMWKYPVLLAPLVFSAFTASSVLESAGEPSLAWRIYELLRGYHYWLGVRSASDSFESFHCLKDGKPELNNSPRSAFPERL